MLDAFAAGGGGRLFRKTSCAVSYVHATADYNGHYGIAELCDICPVAQLDRCAAAHRVPSPEQVHRVGRRLPGSPDFQVVNVTERAVVVAGLDEQPRYFLQHSLGFQVHDVRHPHHEHRHGRAEIGWNGGQPR